MLLTIYSIVFLFIICSTSSAITVHDRVTFLDEFLTRQEIFANVVSVLNMNKHEELSFYKGMSKKYTLAVKKRHNIPYITANRHDVFVADATIEDIEDILLQANERDLLRSPLRWMLFYKHSNTQNCTDLETQGDDMDMGTVGNIKLHIESKLHDVYVGPDTEVYIIFERKSGLHMYLVHRMRPDWPLVWDEYAIWNYSEGFDRPRPTDVLSMKRRDLMGSTMVAATTVFYKTTFDDMPNYLNRGLDYPAKINYYFTKHLFEWMNATGYVNKTQTYGYLQPNGTWDGSIREMVDVRSDFCGTQIFILPERIPAVNFGIATFPGVIEKGLYFVFRKPSLATITNIYALPFSIDVWIASILLILVSALAMGLEDLTLESINRHHQMTIPQRISQSIHDTLSVVFQQGIFLEPVSITGRQILLMGLMAFMFLFTAYSANVVALIQSTSNDITTLEALTNSPFQCGAEDVLYQRVIFKGSENRREHRAFWLKKGAPQGEDFFVPVEEGIRRVREGLYAFHVAETSGTDEMQKTFLEHEKCNLGKVKYSSMTDAHYAISKKSHFLEALRVGGIRIMESGVQIRSIRRLWSSTPRCSAGTAMFTPVYLLFVVPTFKFLLIVYLASALITVLEIYIHRKEKGLKTLRINLTDSISEKEHNSLDK